MADYKPNGNFTVPMKILVPETEKAKGVPVKKYPEPDKLNDDDYLFFGSFKTYGGTETIVNGIVTIIDTAVIETWYRPDIKSNCRIFVIPMNREYEIISPPENIGLRNRYLKFKIKSVGGNP